MHDGPIREMGAALIDKPENQITEQCNQIRNALDKADTLISALHDRLEIVLREEPAQAEAENIKDHELVPLASNLRNHAVRLDYQNSRLGSILDRLEL